MLSLYVCVCLLLNWYNLVGCFIGVVCYFVFGGFAVLVINISLHLICLSFVIVSCYWGSGAYCVCWFVCFLF